MKRKISFCVLAFVMAIIMAVVSPAQVIADGGNKEYIKEIRIGYGEEGKAQLEAAHYTILCNTSSSEVVNANKGGDGDAVYLGYITTKLKEEAITDVALMNMGTETDRSYSFDIYRKEIDALNEQITEKVQNFGAAILEFRDNYNKAAPYNEYALRAYNMLNQFYEDDTLKEIVTKNEDGTETTTKVPVGVGDLLLDKSYTVEAGPVFSEDYKGPDVYRNILMMGNSSAVQAINNALVMGCTETEGSTFLDRLPTIEYTKKLDGNYNFARSVLADVIEGFREYLLLSKSTYDDAMAFDGGKEAYISQFESSDLTDILQRITLIGIMEGIDYGTCVKDDDTRLSFLEAMLLPTDYSDDGSLALTDNIIDILARAMTPGQIAIAQYSGLPSLIFNAYSTKVAPTEGEDGNLHNALEFVDDYMILCDSEDPISVYTGVDRSIFNDSGKTVAITSAAIRSTASNDGFGALPDYNQENKGFLAMGVIGSVVATACTAAAIYTGFVMHANKVKAALNWLEVQQNTTYFYRGAVVYGSSYGTKVNEVVSIGSYGKVATESQWKNYLLSNDLHEHHKLDILKKSYENEAVRQNYENAKAALETPLGSKILLGIEVIAAIAAIVVAVVGFVEWKKSKETENITYTPIPRAIIDVRYKKEGGEGYYFSYYAAKLPNVGDEDYMTETDTTKLYGDVNGHNGKDPWLVLYYARDLRLGSPLTTNALFRKTSSLNPFEEKSYLPVHGFAYNNLDANFTGYAALDLNRTNGNANKPTLFLFFQRDLSVDPIFTGTLFENVFSWSSLVTFAVGAGIAGTTVWLIMKRRSKKQEPAKI